MAHSIGVALSGTQGLTKPHINQDDGCWVGTLSIVMTPMHCQGITCFDLILP